jgi:Zn-dependent protease
LSGVEFIDSSYDVGGLGPCLSVLTRHMEILEVKRGLGDSITVTALENGEVDWLRLYKELSSSGCVAFARREAGLTRILVSRKVEKPRTLLALILGASVVATLYISGYLYVKGAPPGVGGPAWSPLAYLVGLLVPLLIHEFGHYLTMRARGVPSSVPIPLPAPPYPWFLGTFGSVIIMRWPPPTAEALSLIGIAGPIAGYLAAIPVTIWGLKTSILLTHPPPGAGAVPLVPLSMILLAAAFGPQGQGLVVMSPPAFAGYVMFFVTFLNLMPIGQLDGGHVVRAALGERGHSIVSKAFIAALLVASIFYPYLAGFTLIAILLYLLSGGRHPGPAFPEERLGVKGQLAAILYAALLVLTLPVPS